LCAAGAFVSEMAHVWVDLEWTAGGRSRLRRGGDHVHIRLPDTLENCDPMNLRPVSL
jgi:hypothetical protein